MYTPSTYVPALFFCNDTATTEIYTLSLHDALPISARPACRRGAGQENWDTTCAPWYPASTQFRSEEHTSELQSRFDLVCRLLLEKKNEFTASTRQSKRPSHTLHQKMWQTLLCCHYA